MPLAYKDNSMKRVFLGLTIALSAAVSSCVDLTFHTMVKDNGSGTINVEALLDPSISEMYKESKSHERGHSHGDIHGVRVTKTEEGVNKDGRYFVRVQGQFDSFEGLSEDELSYRMQKNGNETTYRIRFVNDNQASDESEEMDDVMGEQMMKMMFGERTIQYKLSVPGRIIKHNASQVNGQTLTWEMSFMTWIKEGLNMEVTCSR